MNTTSIYRRIVGTDGLVSVNRQFYQVPVELADQAIDINITTLKYFRTPRESIFQGVAPVGPLFPTLQPGNVAS